MKKLIRLLIILIILGLAGLIGYLYYLPNLIADAIISGENSSVIPERIQKKIDQHRKESQYG